jgi:hypothetical protein
MKRSTRNTLAVVLVLVGTVAYSALAPTGTIRCWMVFRSLCGGDSFAPLPNSAHHRRVGTDWYTVAYEFSAPPADVERWLRASPRMKNAR